MHTRNSPIFHLTLRLNTISAYDMLLSILSGTQQISELTIMLKGIQKRCCRS
jgi:hypothetical protein